uniref:Putative secreted protein n=1 Tax=Anopheles marajoara TaxID=58244 RepID=A0A2M4CA21_9DIPT
MWSKCGRTSGKLSQTVVLLPAAAFSPTAPLCAESVHRMNFPKESLCVQFSLALFWSVVRLLDLPDITYALLTTLFGGQLNGLHFCFCE